MYGKLQLVIYNRKVKIMTFWDKIADIYDIAEMLNGKVYRKLVSTTEELVPQGAVVLDVAAGTGELSFAAAKKAKKVTCTDLSMNMLQVAKRKAKRKNIKNMDFDVRNIFELKDADETYDVVMAGNVLHLLDEPEKAVRELWRVTRKGGKLFLPTFMIENNFSIIELYKKIGFKPAVNYNPELYCKMLAESVSGKVRVKNIKGLIPCCYAVIHKPLT